MPRCLLLLMLIFLSIGSVQAGLGPQNVLVVVNDASWASKAIANEYVRVRGVPSCNVVRLKNIPVTESISIHDFRLKILKPILQQITARGIEPQIECITYSADFPWRVDLKGDIPAEIKNSPKLPKYLTPYGSLTGMTYLLDLALAKEINYLRLHTNGYFRDRKRAFPNFKPTEEEAAQLKEANELYKQREWAKASDLLTSLTERHKNVPQLWYNLACCRARIEQYEQALDALENSVAAGLTFADQVEKDDDLEPLRKRPKFRELVARMRKPLFDVEEARAFSHRAEFPMPFREKPVHYLLSTMLGVTDGRGNSVAEVISSLKRSAEADFSQPAATFYFARNKNIRSTTREGGFFAASEQLVKNGNQAAIVEGNLPKFRRDVAGLLAGTAGFDWEKSQSTIVPGAICEHLTSYGAVFTHSASQTPISEWIRHGATGTSGTVYEPYALQQKFPTPFLYVHYARGFSLAESFFLSVEAPYQLLILGDPLCQPWAKPPTFEFEFPADEPFSKNVRISPTKTENLDRFDILIDGKQYASTPAAVPHFLSVETLVDGPHVLTIAGLSRELSRTQHIEHYSFEVDRFGKSASLDVVNPEAKKSFAYDSAISFKTNSAGAKKIEIELYGESIATISGDNGEFMLPALELGIGQSELVAIASGEGWSARSRPLIVTVAAPSLIEASGPLKNIATKPGLLLTVGSETKVLENLNSPTWLAETGVKPNQEFTLEGFFEAPRPDLYQLELGGSIDCTVEINSTPVVVPTAGSPFRGMPISLDTGRHHFLFRGTMPANGTGQLLIDFGNRGRKPLDRDRFGCLRP